MEVRTLSIAVILRAAGVLVSILGGCCYVKTKGINMAFAPIIVLTFIGSIMFLAGILNCLKVAAILLWLGGVFRGFLARPWSQKSGMKKYDYGCLLFFCLLCGLFALRIAGCIPTHYDAFSHWLTVVRETMYLSQFPSFRSSMIMFQSYPTGMAGFVFFVCKLAGYYSEGMMLFCQAILMAASLCTFLAFCRRITITNLVVILLGGIFCLIANSGTAIIEPLADTLVSTLSIAVLASVVYYREKPTQALWASLPVQVFLVTVKNSGLFMIFFNTALFAMYALKSARQRYAGCAWKHCLKQTSLHLGIPLSVFFLWERHVEYVFKAGMSAKHSVSLTNYLNELGSKSIETVLEILTVYIDRFFAWNESWELMLILECIILVIFVTGYDWKGNKIRVGLSVAGGILAAYCLFMIGLAAMYLVSMPYPEAVTLAGYSRYEMTILIYLVGATMLYILVFLNDLERSKLGVLQRLVIIAGISLVLLTQGKDITGLLVKTDNYEGSHRQYLEQIKEEYQLPEYRSYLIYGSPITNDGGYHYFMGSYVFWSSNVECCESGKLEYFGGLEGDYEYLIVLDSDEELDSLLIEAGYTPGERAYKLK